MCEICRSAQSRNCCKYIHVCIHSNCKSMRIFIFIRLNEGTQTHKYIYIYIYVCIWVCSTRSAPRPLLRHTPTPRAWYGPPTSEKVNKVNNHTNGRCPAQLTIFVTVAVFDWTPFSYLSLCAGLKSANSLIMAGVLIPRNLF